MEPMHGYPSQSRFGTAGFLLIATMTLVSTGRAGEAAGQQPTSAPIDTTLLGGLSYRNLGPVRGGRSIAVAGSSSRPYEYYFGATGGGLWKTTDGGTTWNPVTDGQITSSSVGAVAQCEADPDVVYMGMGEVQLRGNIMQGDGVYKSTDAGETWQHVGLAETQAIGRVRVHPGDCNTVWVAALGHPFGRNPERGIFRSRDGGGTWEKVLFVNDSTGAVDLALDPGNPDVMYAGFWQVNRKSWGMFSGGPGSGLHKSTDGGSTWTSLKNNPGLPQSIWGKVGVSVSGADPNRVYAIIEADSGGVFVSDDAGATWTRTNQDRNLRQRAFYYTRIYADPQQRDVVYVLNVGFHKSTDGGKTFPTTIRVPHGDNHDMWIAPNDNQRMVNGNDGGGNVSFNGGETWTDQDYATAQLYHITTTNHVPYWVCGAQQDNSTACVASSGWQQMADLVAVGGGESGYITSDPELPNIFYSGSYGGLLTRYDYATGRSEVINVWPENPMGHSSEDIRERFQWTFPIVFSRSGPQRLYVGSQHLWMTTDMGQSWQRLSPDLTRADPATLGPSGGPITRDQTGVETYGTIFTIAPSPHDANTIWTGSDDGYIQITRDHGQTWSNITPPDMPEFGRVSLIEVSPHRPGAAFAAVKRYQLDDRAPYIFRTTDYGRTWTKIVNGMRGNDYVHAVREDPVRQGLLFAGTEHGIYISFDDGANWQDFRRNLPDVQVADLAVTGNDLVIGTHGRSAWVMEDITQLRQITPAVASADAHLFDPPDARRGIDNGVAIKYFLDAPADSVTLDILDAQGNLVRSYTGRRPAEGGRGGENPAGGGRGGGGGGRGGFGGGTPSTNAGVNRFNWNMQHEGAITFPNMILWAAGGNTGPNAIPGLYQARLRVNGAAPRTAEFEILMDPRYPEVTMADLQAQFDLARQVRDRFSEANQAVIAIRDIKSQIDDRIEKDASVSAQGDPLKTKFTEVEGEIYQYRNQSNQDPLNFPIKLNNKLGALMGAVQGVRGRPPAQTYEVFEYLSSELQTELDRIQVLITTDLEQFNRMLRDKGLDPIQPPAPRQRVVT
jgi:photosystem II stability/assembly factor-like uncharacterized protein